MYIYIYIHIYIYIYILTLNRIETLFIKKKGNNHTIISMKIESERNIWKVKKKKKLTLKLSKEKVNK